MNFCKSFLMLATSLAALSFAAKAPTHHSLRAEAMGNAHVAVVDDKEAIILTTQAFLRLTDWETTSCVRSRGTTPVTWATCV